MSIDLTDNQKKIIKWIVEKVQEGRLTEGFTVVWDYEGVSKIVELKLNCAEEAFFITKGALSALEKAGLLICHFGEVKDIVFCQLTGSAFTVANDFQEIGTLVTDLQAIQLKFYQNREQFREQVAKYEIDIPLSLLNQIGDHQRAIQLTDRLLRAAAQLQQELELLNIDLDLKSRLISIVGKK